MTGGDPSLGPDETFRRLYDVLQDGQEEATAAVRPGVPCERIDAVARGIIDAAGFGPNFFHRTGHGIGLEGHEDPYLVAGNAEPLARGHRVQRGARASTSRAGTARGSRTSSSAATPGRSSSTRRRGTCWSSRADPEARRSAASGGIIRRSVGPSTEPRAHDDKPSRASHGLALLPPMSRRGRHGHHAHSHASGRPVASRSARARAPGSARRRRASPSVPSPASLLRSRPRPWPPRPRLPWLPVAVGRAEVVDDERATTRRRCRGCGPRSSRHPASRRTTRATPSTRRPSLAPAAVIAADARPVMDGDSSAYRDHLHLRPAPPVHQEPPVGPAPRAPPPVRDLGRRRRRVADPRRRPAAVHRAAARGGAHGRRAAERRRRRLRAVARPDGADRRRRVPDAARPPKLTERRHVKAGASVHRAVASPTLTLRSANDTLLVNRVIGGWDLRTGSRGRRVRGIERSCRRGRSRARNGTFGGRGDQHRQESQEAAAVGAARPPSRCSCSPAPSGGRAGRDCDQRDLRGRPASTAGGNPGFWTSLSLHRHEHAREAVPRGRHLEGGGSTSRTIRHHKNDTSIRRSTCSVTTRTWPQAAQPPVLVPDRVAPEMTSGWPSA